MKPILQLLATLGFVACISGCGVTDSTAPSRGPEGPQIQSGNPAVLKKYDAYYIPDIEVYSLEGDVLRRVNDREVENLARNFRTKLIRELDSKYTMFSQPASNVAILKIALSDVSSTYTLFQLYPGLIVPNAMRGGASIDAKLVDSVSGKEVLSFRDTRQGARQGFLGGLGKWDGVETAFDEWAMQLKGAVAR